MKKIDHLTSNRPLHRVLVVALLFGALLAGLSFNPSKAATGATITVNTTADGLANDGYCTLREAVIAANTGKPSGSKSGECKAGDPTNGTTINLPNNLTGGAVFVLSKNDSGKEDSPSAGDLDITSNITIQALIIQAGGPNVVVKGAAGFNTRIVQVIYSGTGTPPKATLSGFTLSGGNTPNNGGAIANQGALTLDKVTITGNNAVLAGGGVYNDSMGTLVIKNSTISGNNAGLDGGGLYNNNSNSGSVTLNNVTITANKADSDANGTGDGGGIFSNPGSSNTGSVKLSNTIVAGNADSGAQAPDCAGTLNSAGYNLIQSSAGCTISGTLTGNIIGQRANLGLLQNNGGYTSTHALLSGSPAIDAGNPATPGTGSGTCETTDQRGNTRPRGTACDIGAFEILSPPVIIRAFPNTATNTTTVQGWLSGTPGTTYTLNFYSGANCTGLISSSPFSPTLITTDSSGISYFSINVSPVPVGQYLVVTATGPNGDVSLASSCILVGLGNDSWPRALPLTLQPNGTFFSTTVDQFVDTLGESRWFKFTVQPGSQLIVTLTGQPNSQGMPTPLPANYDLTLYKDIAAAYQGLTSTQDLVRMGAESAPSAFTPSAFTPSAFTPSAFTPSAFTSVSQDVFSSAAFSPSAFTPSAFTPSAFTPSAFTPSAFTPSAFTAAAISPDALTPSAFTPSAFTPSAFTPSAFTPSAFTPSILDPAAFASAQTRSLIGVSAFDGTAPEGLILNTWNNTGTFYVRVRGREGAFSLNAPFHLQVLQLPGNCGNLDTTFATHPYSTVATAGNFKTIILADFGRMATVNGDSAADLTTLQNTLTTFAARPEVGGVIVDVGKDNQVSFANSQADTNYACPFAKNLVAQSIKGIVDNYRSLNPSLQYVVVIGSDGVIPFFRYPDQSLLGSEDNYVPPVRDNTASQASLRLNYVLSQDAYGSKINISMLSNVFPVPNLPVGRLVETSGEVTHMLNVYMGGNPAGGDVVVTPSTAMVTGYDFLADDANAVSAELKAGLGSNGTVDDSLITAQGISPADPASWTADQLRQHFLSTRHDITFLAGHFSAVSAEAADYSTYMLTTDLISSTVNLNNAIVFSAGCHSGYNIVTQDAVPNVTFEPDWAQAFARKGATLIAGTGYQYGDTDFIQYSERLYLDFSQQLRTGSGAVSVGNALVAAKQMYLSSTPQLRGIHEKALLESTLFGLPMLKVNMPGARLPSGNGTTITPSATPFQTNPGAALGLQSADVSVIPSLTQNNVPLTNLDGGSVTAVYYSGKDGVLSNPLEPTLPLEVNSVIAPPPPSGQPNLVLRGIGFRGGIYSDLSNVLPLVGAPTTEIRGVHAPFLSDVFFPVQPWDVNYYGALADPVNGATRLVVTPAQFRSAIPGASVGTLRTYNKMDFRLYFSNYIATSSTGTSPAQAAAPSIVRVLSAVPGNGTVTFNVNVIGDPAAGIQQVWVTWTDTSNPAGGTWQSLDLTQNAQDSTSWQGTLALNGLTAANLRFIVQACNGVGLCNMATNLGAYYIPGVQAAPSKPTSLAFVSQPASGVYGAQATFSAVLTDQATGSPLANQRVIFNLGALGRQVQTNASGVASATFPLLSIAGQYNLSAFFPGSGDYQVSAVATIFTIQKQATSLSLSIPSTPVGLGKDTQVTAQLLDAAGIPMSEKNVCFVVSTIGKCQITDYLGRVFLGSTALPSGTYTVNAFFSGSIPLPGGAINVSDDRYLPSTTTGTVTINTPPVAADDSYDVQAGSILSVPAPGILGNDTDVNGQTLTAVLVTPPTHGTLALNPNGSFTYTPNAGFSGSDGFTYKASDGLDLSNLAQVTIMVVPSPNLSNAAASVPIIWSPNGTFVQESIVGLDSSLRIEINGQGPCGSAICQDEQVGKIADATIDPNNPNSFTVHAIRNGSGDGRVYHVYFTVYNDQYGLSWKGEVVIHVTHDQSPPDTTIDEGPLYNSLVPGP